MSSDAEMLEPELILVLIISLILIMAWTFTKGWFGLSSQFAILLHCIWQNVPVLMENLEKLSITVMM